MSHDNPFASFVRDPNDFEFAGPGKAGKERLVLASRFSRLNAALVDAIIALVVTIPMFNVMGIWSYLANRQNPPLRLMLVSSAIGFLGFLVIHGYFLKKNGQTIGKMLLGIRIVDLQGNVPAFPPLVAQRYLCISLASLIPGIGSYVALVDCLFIFRSDRRCLHDLIAGTQVVEARTAL